MALKDIWIKQDNTMDADAKVVNEIASAVIELEEEMEDLPSGGTGLTEEQLANIDKIPSIEKNIGDIEKALDSIIAMQNDLIGGDGV